MIEEIERQEIYDFLEQSGVKGMKWGVRRSLQRAQNAGVQLSPRSTKRLEKGNARDAARGITRKPVGAINPKAAARVQKQETRAAIFDERSTKQKVAINVVAGAAAVGGYFASKKLTGSIGASPISVLGGLGTGLAAGALTEKFLDRHGSKPVSAPKSKAADKAPKPPKPTKHEQKQIKFAAAQKKAEDLFDAGAKNPNDLILLNGRQVVTGREFVDHMTNGGLMDINSTRVYARQKTPDGPYELEA